MATEDEAALPDPGEADDAGVYPTQVELEGFQIGTAVLPNGEKLKVLQITISLAIPFTQDTAKLVAEQLGTTSGITIAQPGQIPEL